MASMRIRDHSLMMATVGVTAICLLLFCLKDNVRSEGDNRTTPLDLSTYTLTFDENFDTLDVSPWGPGTRWIAHTPWNGDFGDAGFVNPRPGFPFTIADGVLRIEARRGTDGKWRSGLLASTDPNGNGFKQRYGYFE